MTERAAIKQLPLEYWLRVLGDFFTGFGRSMLIPFMLIFLKQSGGFPTWVATLLTAVPQFLQLFSTSWGGVLADYYGRKPIMFLSLFGSGAALSLMLSTNYLVVYMGYVAFLVVSNFYRPAAFAMVTDVVPLDLHRDAFAILRTSANLGFALGPLVGGVMFFSNRPVVISGTIVAYLLTGCTVFLMRETVTPAAKHSGTGQGSKLHEDCARGTGFKLQNPLGSFKLLKSDILLRWTVIMGVLFLMVMLQMFSSFTVVVNDQFGDAGRTLSLLLLINTAGVVVGQYFVTAYTRNLSFFTLMKIAIFAAGLGWGMMLLPIGASRFYLIMIFTTLGEILMSAGYNPFIAGLAKEGEVAQYMSFSQTSSIMGQMFGPTLGAIGYDLGGQTGYVAVLWVLTTATFVSLWKLKRLAAKLSANVQD